MSNQLFKKINISVKKEDRKVNFNETFSLTFGDQAENNIGMEQLGTLADEGLKIKDLQKCIKKLEKNNIDYQLIKLHDNLPQKYINLEEKDKGVQNHEAHLLIIRNGINFFLNDEKGADKMYFEQKSLPFDKKALMRGRVVNKRARWNSCFAPTSQEPDIKNGKGTVIGFDRVPVLNKLRKSFKTYFGNKTKDLMGEMNYYYDLNECGIGFHGDAERRIVVCARLAGSMSMHFQWFYKFKPIGKRIKFTLNHGDIYAMSEKATGFDWKKSSYLTLRHAAGSSKYTTIKK